MNYEQVDGNKNILIDGLGRLLKNGITPVNPVVDPESGLKTFTTPIPGRAGEVETRYVHVEVFRTHGSIKSCPRLEPEDVEFVDEDANPAEKLTNLALSESGRAKVYGGEEENVGGEDVEDENVEDENVECRSSGVQEEEGISNIEQGIPDDELEEEQSTELQSDEVQSEEDSEVQEPEVQKVEEPSPLSPPAERKDNEKVFKWKRAGACYDLIDPDTEESVLADFEVEKKPRGKDGAEALGAELAEKFGIATSF
jgi:hypothetical protein